MSVVSTRTGYKGYEYILVMWFGILELFEGGEGF